MIVSMWTYLLVVRFQYSGQVCSGDYLKEKQSHDGYLIEMGFAIKLMLIIVMTLIFIAFIAGLAVGLSVFLFAAVCCCYEEPKLIIIAPFVVLGGMISHLYKLCVKTCRETFTSENEAE